MNVLGIDLSSKAVDLVLLDENADKACHQRIDLVGDKAFDRCRDVRRAMPAESFFDMNGVYLVALERPFVRRGQDVIRLVQGAVLACIPRRVEVWEVSPSQWKNYVRIPMREKPDALTPAFGSMLYEPGGEWSQDAFDALGVALYARDLNATAVELELARAAL